MSNATVNIEAEYSVLGSMLLDANCVRDVLPKLRAEDFALERNRELWNTIQGMELSGARIDALTVAERMHADDQLRQYLKELLEVTPTAVNVMEYAAIVADAGKRRRLRTALSDALTAIDERKADDEIFPHVEAAIEAYDDRSREGILSPVAQSSAFFAHRDGINSGTPPFTRTGFDSLDKMLGGGTLDGDLYFLAARPGTGKTALALNIGDYVAANVGPVLFESMEMSAAQIMSRRIAMAARIDSQRLLMQPLTQAEHDLVAKATVELGSRPFFLCAKGARSMQQVSSDARAIKGLRLLLIDHFTLFSRPHRQQDFSEYAEISHALKNLASRLRVPVLCLIQVSREDGQKKKRSRLDSLRGSGATEEDASGVLFIEHASDTVESDGQPREEKVILEKNRYGPTGSITMSYQPRYNTFAEIVDEKAVMRKYVEDGKAVKEKNHREAMKQQELSDLPKSEERGMPF